MTQRIKVWKTVESINLSGGAVASYEQTTTGDDYRISVAKEDTGKSVVIANMPFKDAASKNHVRRTWSELVETIGRVRG